MPPAVDRAYSDRLLGLVTTTADQRQACRILYSPLHGSGNIPVRQVLGAAGYQISVVKAQELPDLNFSTGIIVLGIVLSMTAIWLNQQPSAPPQG